MARVVLKDVRVGSIVMVRGGFGTDAPVKARVDNIERDIKNGYPGIDYTVMKTGDELWAYIDQVDSVVTY